MIHEQDEQRTKKNERERKRRGEEQDQMKRVSRLFKTVHDEQWSKQDLLGFCEKVFLIDGWD